MPGTAVVVLNSPYHQIGRHLVRDRGWTVAAVSTSLAQQHELGVYDGHLDLFRTVEDAKDEPLPDDARRTARGLEDRYDVNLADILAVDRHMGIGWVTGGLYHRGRLAELPYERHLHILARMFEACEGFLDRVDPDVVLGGVTGCAELSMLETVCRRRDLDHLAIQRLGDGAHFYWTSDRYLRVPGLEAAYERVKEDPPDGGVDASAVAPKVRRDTDLYKQKGRFLDLLSRGVHEVVREVMHKITGYRKTGEVPLRSQLRYLRRNYENFHRELGRETVPLEELEGRRFVYYPLHYEPEASLNGTEPHFTNQTYAVELLSRAVPSDYAVAVKEHPAGVGNRPEGWIDRIADFPRVEIVEPFESSIEMIEAATVTATITGSAGLEAALMGEPVIAMGPNYRFAFVDHVHVTSDLLELRELIPRLDDDGRGEERRRAGRALARAVEEVCFDLERPVYDATVSPGAVRDATKHLLDRLESPPADPPTP